MDVGSSYKIGIDGGGTKTEGVLVDGAGTVVARQIAAGCNPNVVGVDQARFVLTDLLCALRAKISRPASGSIGHTALYMAGNRAFWQEFAATLTEFGATSAHDDSLPVLELATEGRPGLVLHAGTGSFVAARGADGAIHYAGGLGWRFGDPGSGYDLGRRAVAHALLELQGWVPPSRLGPLVTTQTGITDAHALSRYFYQDAAANQKIAALAPGVLHLATEGDRLARTLITDSVGGLLELAAQVAAKLFPDQALDTIPAGLSGPILTHPVVRENLLNRSPLPLVPVNGTPIDGVRRLLARL